MDLIDALEKSWAASTTVVARLDPSQLDAPTPCIGWDVRAVLDHTLGEAAMMTAVNRGEPFGGNHGDLTGDGSTLLEEWTRIGADNVASWRSSGLEGKRTYFYGTYPAPASIVINLGEVLVHSWDLARATGQSVELDPDLVAPVHDLYASYPLDGMRANGQLGPEVPVPPDATPAARLLGLLGRQP